MCHLEKNTHISKKGCVLFQKLCNTIGELRVICGDGLGLVKWQDHPLQVLDVLFFQWCLTPTHNAEKKWLRIEHLAKGTLQQDYTPPLKVTCCL